MLHTLSEATSRTNIQNKTGHKTSHIIKRSFLIGCQPIGQIDTLMSERKMFLIKRRGAIQSGDQSASLLSFHCCQINFFFCSH